MKKALAALLAFILMFAGRELFAHPGSGIAVDRQGNVYFIDTGSGVWTIDREGKLTKLSAPAFHWMAMDVDGKLGTVTLPHYSRSDATVTRDPNDSRILVSSDFPVAVGPDGSLYYPWLDDNEQPRIYRLAPSGTTTVVATGPSDPFVKSRHWVNGLAATPDGSVYFTEDRAVKRITPQGKLTTVIANIRVSDCISVPGAEPELGPYLRGLDIDAQGTVYAAAAGCGAVLKITPDKKVTTVLRTSSPWSPTAVAVSGTDLYVLEYLHTASDNRREWLPRVRKVSADGRVSTIAEIHR